MTGEVPAAATEDPAEITLYVAGSARSSQMIERITGEARALGSRLRLSIVDVLEDPGRAERDTVLTTPMMVRWSPSPVRRLTGDIAGLAQLMPSAQESPAPATPPAGSGLTGDRDAGAVISRAAHELRTPLTVIHGFAGTLLDAISNVDQQTAVKCSRAILRGCTQLQTIIDSMLVARSVERGGVHLDLVDVSLGQLTQETVRDLEALGSQHRVMVDVTEDVVVQADPAKIRQIITNLMTNAFKFSPDGSTVTVSVRATPRDAILIVDDEGPGVAPDQLETIFEQYERLGRMEKGMGIGLYISRHLALAHGGQLSAFSDGMHGTHMQLRLPRDGFARSK